MSKHTPGPWRIVGPANPDKFQIEDRMVVAEPQQHIAEVFQYRADDMKEADGTALANAALIAAAPDLLEACKAIELAHSALFVLGVPLTVEGKPIDHSLLNEAARLAGIAITKAGAQ